MTKKDFYRSLLSLIKPARLKRIAMDNFTRMDGPYTHEDYVQRTATASRFSRVIEELNLVELRVLAKHLKLDIAGLSRDDLFAAILNFETQKDTPAKRASKTASKGETVASPVYALLKKGVGYEKLLPLLTKQRQKNGGMTKGEQIMWGAMGAAFGASIRHAGPEYVFMMCHEAWPKIVLDSLRIIGATKSANLLKKQFAELFHNESLTGKELLKAASRIKEKPQATKLWREAWQATGEDVDEMARKYLLDKPQLF